MQFWVKVNIHVTLWKQVKQLHNVALNTQLYPHEVKHLEVISVRVCVCVSVCVSVLMTCVSVSWPPTRKTLTHCKGRTRPGSPTWWSPRWRPPAWPTPAPRRKDPPPPRCSPSGRWPGGIYLERRGEERRGELSWRLQPAVSCESSLYANCISTNC